MPPNAAAAQASNPLSPRRSQQLEERRASKVDTGKLKAILEKLEVSEIEYYKTQLGPLLDYKVAILADDSGSMRRGYHELLSHAELDPAVKRDTSYKDDRGKEYWERIKLMKTTLWNEFTDAEKQKWRNDDSATYDARRGLLEEKRIQLTRFKEVEKGCRFLIDVCGCYGPVDLFFLNRPGRKNIKNDKEADECFVLEPNGETLLVDRVKQVVNRTLGDLPVLLFILTDGHPDGDAEDKDRVSKFLCKAVETEFTADESMQFNHQPTGRKKTTMPKFRVQMMHCTENGDDTEWLDELDEKGGAHIDAVDDYHTELQQVLKAARMRGHKITEKDFTLGDWVLKAITGPLNKDLDKMDEGGSLKIQAEIQAAAVEKQAKRAAKKAAQGNACVIS